VPSWSVSGARPSIIPLILVFVVLGRRLVAGILQGAVKG
jgi:ABC-type glycerol-3-phosphate transport system permease component